MEFFKNSVVICFADGKIVIKAIIAVVIGYCKKLSEFFRDLDFVPSDIEVGLVLLSKRQRLLRLKIIHQVRILSFLIEIL